MLLNNSASHCERTTGPIGFKLCGDHLHREFQFLPPGVLLVSQCIGGTTYSIRSDTIVVLYWAWVTVPSLGKIHPWEMCLAVHCMSEYLMSTVEWGMFNTYKGPDKNIIPNQTWLSHKEYFLIHGDPSTKSFLRLRFHHLHHCHHEI